MSNRLQDKTAFITGAAQGIGNEIARAFLKEGANVIATDINEKKLEELAGELGCQTHVLNVADAKAIANCGASYPNVDVLVNCAGIVRGGTILECTEQDWSLSLQLNVTSMYHTTRAFLPAMLERGKGSIVNIASIVSSENAAASRFAYGASKAAVIGLTKSVAMDFIGQGIRCNSISPGTVDSPSFRDRVAGAEDPEAAQKAFLARQPMGRIGRADEIAAIAVLLASDEARYMTGINTIIDGGWSL